MTKTFVNKTQRNVHSSFLVRRVQIGCPYCGLSETGHPEENLHFSLNPAIPTPRKFLSK